MTVEQALSSAGYVVSHPQLSGGQVVLGCRRDFRVQWFLTQLKTSVVVATTGHLDSEAWRAFVTESFAVAKAVKGGLPNGFQSGVGLVAVMSCDSLDEGVMAQATQMAPRAWFKGISVSAVHDRSTGRVHQHDGSVLVGRAYIPFLRSQRDLVLAALA